MVFQYVNSLENSKSFVFKGIFSSSFRGCSAEKQSYCKVIANDRRFGILECVQWILLHVISLYRVHVHIFYIKFRFVLLKHHDTYPDSSQSTCFDIIVSFFGNFECVHQIQPQVISLQSTCAFSVSQIQICIEEMITTQYPYPSQSPFIQKSPYQCTIVFFDVITLHVLPFHVILFPMKKFQRFNVTLTNHP